MADECGLSDSDADDDGKDKTATTLLCHTALAAALSCGAVFGLLGFLWARREAASSRAAALATPLV
jgi:hypothetical protein